MNWIVLISRAFQGGMKGAVENSAPMMIAPNQVIFECDWQDQKAQSSRAHFYLITSEWHTASKLQRRGSLQDDKLCSKTETKLSMYFFLLRLFYTKYFLLVKKVSPP